MTHPAASVMGEIRGLFEQVVELPPGERSLFLDRACPGDPDLRQAVERLLTAEARLGSLFTSWVSSSPFDSGDEPSTPAFDLGGRVGPYEIVASLGAGGMGEVYEARDTRLDRLVAIKVVSRRLSSDPRMRDRFMREARAIAALSHPHICQLFDVGRLDGVDFLVMEHLPGETLAARLHRGRLNREEALRYALQIADALDAAHRGGILHRDLKPANVMLTPLGAKLLDFGLAGRRTVVVGAPEPDRERSGRRGAVLGTLPYLAPEVLEGGEADEQADVYAFGAVLFEMLSGRRPFDGQSGAAVIAQILNGVAPSLRDSGGQPAAAWLERLVASCLAKAPTARPASIAHVRDAIASGRQVSRRHRLGTAVLGASLAGAGILSLVLRPTPGLPRLTGTYRVTYDGTYKDLPYTDGARVYYVSWAPGFSGTALFQVPITGGASQPLPTPFAKPYIHDVSAAGEMLLVDAAARPSRLHLMRVQGGTPRPMGALDATAADLSSDGRRVVFVDEKRLAVADRDGSRSRELARVVGGLMLPRWAPDGRRIRYTVQERGVMTMWETTSEGGTPREVLPGWSACCGAWMPGGEAFVFEAERDGDYGLWLLPERRGWGASQPVPIRLTTGPMRYENAVPTPDGSTILALGSAPPATELARFDATTNRFTQALGGLAARNVVYSPDRRSIAYVRNDDDTLWRSGIDGRDPVQLTRPPSIALGAAWSPDGRQIAVATKRSSEPWTTSVMDADGGDGRRITGGDRDEADPSWHPDGRRLAISGTDPATGRWRIRIVDVVSGRSEILHGSDGLFAPSWSPDGASIAAIARGSDRLLLYDVARRRWNPLLEGTYLGWHRWSADGKHIQLQLERRVVRVHIADRRIEAVADLAAVRQAVSRPVGSSWLGMAPDGSPLVLREIGGAQEIYALKIAWR